MRGLGPSEVCRRQPVEGAGGGGAGEAAPQPLPHSAAEAHPPACVTQEVQKEELRQRKEGGSNKRYKPTKIHWISRERQTGQEREENQIQQRGETQERD